MKRKAAWLSFAVVCYVWLAAVVATAQDDGWRPVYARQTTSSQVSDEHTPQAVLDQAWDICRIRVGNISGSGTYLGNRYVLSCDHVASRGQFVECQFPVGGGSGRTNLDDRIRGFVVRSDSRVDTALIRLERDPRFADGVQIAATEPARGDLLVPAGYSSGTLRFFPGRSLGTDGRSAWYSINNWANPGDSGGPVFTESGELVGSLHRSTGAGGETIATTVGVTLGFLHEFRMQLGCGPPGWGSSPGTGRSPSGPGRIEDIPDWAKPDPSTPQGELPPAATPSAPACPAVDYDRLTAELILAIRADPDLLAQLRGPEGPQGPAGSQGPAGPEGQVSQEQINAIAAAIAQSMPGFTARTIDENGVELDRVTVPLGGTLNIQHRPIPVD